VAESITRAAACRRNAEQCERTAALATDSEARRILHRTSSRLARAGRTKNESMATAETRSGFAMNSISRSRHVRPRANGRMLKTPTWTNTDIYAVCRILFLRSASAVRRRLHGSGGVISSELPLCLRLSRLAEVTIATRYHGRDRLRRAGPFARRIMSCTTSIGSTASASAIRSNSKISTLRCPRS
jgi:hypothetical protein